MSTIHIVVDKWVATFNVIKINNINIKIPLNYS